MNFKKIAYGVLLIPSLILTGCSCKKDTPPNDTVEYTTVERTEVVELLSQMKQEEKFNINGYEFNIVMGLPNIISNEVQTLDEESEYKTGDPIPWPNLSTDEWLSISMSGTMLNENNKLSAKYSYSYPQENQSGSNDTMNIYIKDNTIYADTGENKFKTTFTSESELESLELANNLPSMDEFLSQVDLIINAEDGLSYEKGTKDGKNYYHIWGIPKISDISLDLPTPLEMYLVFENNQLVSCKYQTFLLFVYTEIEINNTVTEITFPEDLDSYIPNNSWFEEADSESFI